MDKACFYFLAYYAHISMQIPLMAILLYCMLKYASGDDDQNNKCQNICLSSN